MAKARTDSETAKKAQALREAAELGCTGAHRHPDGTWMACSTMEEYERLTASRKEKSGLDLIEETQKIRSQKGSKRKRQNKRQWEKLRERGVAGIDTLSGGGLVSGAHGKGLTFRPVDGDEDVFDNINDARRRARRLGCIGVSRRTSRSGRRVWVPCTNMTDYARATGSTALGRRYQDRMARQRVRRIVQEEMARAHRNSRKRRKKRLIEELYDTKILGRRLGGRGRIGRIGRSMAVFDPDAWDGDMDGIVQEGTPWERPSIPGINTNLPGTRRTRRKPRSYPKDDPGRVDPGDEHYLSYYTDLDSNTGDLEGFMPGRDQYEADLRGGMRSQGAGGLTEYQKILESEWRNVGRGKVVIRRTRKEDGLRPVAVNGEVVGTVNPETLEWTYSYEGKSNSGTGETLMAVQDRLSRSMGFGKAHRAQQTSSRTVGSGRQTRRGPGGGTNTQWNFPNKDWRPDGFEGWSADQKERFLNYLETRDPVGAGPADRGMRSRQADLMATPELPEPREPREPRGGTRSVRSFNGEPIFGTYDDEGPRFRIDVPSGASGTRSRRIDPKGSSAVAKIHYDAKKEELTVSFTGGKGAYVFGGITSEMVDDIESAPSVGRAVNDMQTAFWARLNQDGTGYLVKPDGTKVKGTPILHPGPRDATNVVAGEPVADPDFPHPALTQESHAEHTQMVPIEFFDNMPGNIQGQTDRDDRLVAAPAGVLRDFEIDAPIILQMTDDLTDNVRSNGIKNALMVNYNPQTGDVNLEEGNHRLIAARRLGMTHVPVRMNRTTVEREGIRGPRKQIGGMRKNERYEHLDLNGEYLGSAFKPSQVGISTRSSRGGMRSEHSEALDKQYRDKYGGDRPDGDGNCYAAASHFAFLEGRNEKKYPNLRIVHGLPMGQGEISGQRFDHSWVEFADPDTGEIWVIDKSNGNDLLYQAVAYYAIGKIDPADIKRYTREQAKEHQDNTGIYGPWDIPGTPSGDDTGYAELDDVARRILEAERHFREGGTRSQRVADLPLHQQPDSPEISEIRDKMEDRDGSFEELLATYMTPEEQITRLAHILHNEHTQGLADSLMYNAEYQKALQDNLNRIFGPGRYITLYRGRLPGREETDTYVSASVSARMAGAFGRGGFALLTPHTRDGELIEMKVPKGNVAFHGSAEEAEFVVLNDENVTQRVVESLKPVLRSQRNPMDTGEHKNPFPATIAEIGNNNAEVVGTRSGRKRDAREQAIVDTAKKQLKDIFRGGEFSSDAQLDAIASDLTWQQFAGHVPISDEQLEGLRDALKAGDAEVIDMLREVMRVRETIGGARRLRESKLDSGVGIHGPDQDIAVNGYDSIFIERPGDPITLYHGGHVDLTGDVEYEVGRADSGQFGPGIYTTASHYPAVNGWARPWRKKWVHPDDGPSKIIEETGPPGYLHTVRWKGDSPPRILDMEEPLPPDVRELSIDLYDEVKGAIKRAKTTYVGGKLELTKDQQYHADGVIESLEYKVKRILNGHDTTGREILLELQVLLQDVHLRPGRNDDRAFLTTDTIDEIRTEIQQRVGALGYDVIKSVETGITWMNRTDYMFLNPDTVEFVDVAKMTTMFGWGNGFNSAVNRAVERYINRSGTRSTRSTVDKPRPSPFDKEVARLDEAAAVIRAATGRGPLPPRITQADKERMATRSPKQNLRDLDTAIDEYVAFLEDHHRHNFSGDADAISAIDTADPGLVNRHDRHKDRLNEIASFFEEERASLKEAQFEQQEVRRELKLLTERLDRANAGPSPGASQRRRMSQAMSEGRQRDEFLAAEFGDLAVRRDALDPNGLAATWRAVEGERNEIRGLELKLEQLQREVEAHPNGSESTLKEFRKQVQAKFSKHQRPDKVLEIGKGNEALNPGQGMRSRRDALSDHNKEWLRILQANPAHWDDAPAAVRNVASDQLRQQAMQVRSSPRGDMIGMRSTVFANSGLVKHRAEILGKVEPEHQGKQRPTLYYVGGTVGVGKSSLTVRDYKGKRIQLPDETQAAHIDIDIHKRRLDGFDPNNPMPGHGAAVRSADTLHADAAAAGMDVVYQSTGKRAEPFELAKSRGDRIVGHFVWAPEDEVERRVIKRHSEPGGIRVEAGVPTAVSQDLRNTIGSRITNGTFDEFYLWDNSGPLPRLIAYRGKDGHFAIYGRREFDAFFGASGKDVERYWQKNQTSR